MPPLGALSTPDALERRPASWPPPGSRTLRYVLVALLVVPVALAVPRWPASALPHAGVPIAYAHASSAPATAAAAAAAESARADRPAPDEGDGRPAPPPMPAVELPAGWGWVVDALWGVLGALFRAYLERASLEAQRELDRFWELGLPEYATRLAGRLLWSALWVTITFWDAALSRLCCADWKVLEHTAPQLTYAHPAVRSLLAALRREPGDVAAGLAARLRRFVDGSLRGLFGGPTNVALDRPLTVFDVRRLEPELRPLTIHDIAAFVWGRVRHARRPRLLVVDEAWGLLQHPAGGAFLSGLARRARKHYLGLVTISQDVTDFLASDHGAAVVRNAAVKVLLKQDHTTVGPVVQALHLSAEERRTLLAAGKGEALLCARGARVPLRIDASPLEHRLATTAPWEVGAPPGAGDRPVPAASGAAVAGRDEGAPPATPPDRVAAPALGPVTPDGIASGSGAGGARAGQAALPFGSPRDGARAPGGAA